LPTKLDATLKDNARLVKENERLGEQAAQVAAEQVKRVEVQRARVQGKTAAAKKRIKDDSDAAAKKLAAMGYQLNIGMPPEAAYYLGKIATNHIREAWIAGKGQIELDAVINKTLKQFPEFTRRQVMEAMNARAPKQIAKAKSEARQWIQDLKKQARLSVELDDAMNGVFRARRRGLSPLTKAGESAAVKKLQDKLTEVRKASWGSGLEAAKIERAQATMDRLQDDLANHRRAIKASKPTAPSPELKGLKDKIAGLQREMRTEDVRLDLEDQLRTGEIRIRRRPEPTYTSPQLEANQIAIRRLRRQQRDLIAQRAPWTARRIGVETVNTLRTALATADLSGTLRQGFIATVTDPMGSAKDFGKSLEATFSRYKDEQIMNSLRKSPNYPIYDAANWNWRTLMGCYRDVRRCFNLGSLRRSPLSRKSLAHLNATCERI
jgi:hypothetical protein